MSSWKHHHLQTVGHVFLGKWFSLCFYASVLLVWFSNKYGRRFGGKAARRFLHSCTSNIYASSLLKSKSKNTIPGFTAKDPTWSLRGPWLHDLLCSDHRPHSCSHAHGLSHRVAHGDPCPRKTVSLSPKRSREVQLPFLGPSLVTVPICELEPIALWFGICMNQ